MGGNVRRTTRVDHACTFGEPSNVAERPAGPARLNEAARHVYGMLSPREVAIVLGAARGSEDKEIAAQLGCTLSTVRTLWQRVYRKTQTSSRRRLIATLWEEACYLGGPTIPNGLDVTDSPAAYRPGACATGSSLVR